MFQVMTSLALLFLYADQIERIGAPRYHQMSAEERSPKDRENGHCGMPYDNEFAPDQGNAGVGINHKGES